MSERICLDLFAGLGGFSAAFSDSARWDVTTVEIAEKFDPDIQADVLDLRPADLPAADIVLASPPCTNFSPAQNLNGEHTPPGEDILLVYHTLGLIKALGPEYWFLENPRGRLRSYIGRPTTTVTYCRYGEQRMKPTDLWGEHPPGFAGRRCAYGDDCHINHRDGSNAARDQLGMRTAADRAKVPYDLSEAILEAVEGRAEQATFAEVAR